MSEAARIELLRQLFASMPGPAPRVGIGDDAAVLSPLGSDSLVASVDEQIEGTHFRRAWLGAADIGYRSMMAALSDLAAMGATPLAALAALALPDDIDDAFLAGLAQGQREAAASVMCPIVGGNLARGPCLAVTTTVLGTAATPIGRNGARSGDGLYVAGALGLAAAGLQAFLRGDASGATAAARAAWARPVARIADGLSVRDTATAAIDVSDGVAKDLGAVATASGCVAELEEVALRAHLAATGADAAASALSLDALALALFGGEDYALLVASPTALEGFTRIGRFGDRGHEAVLKQADGTTRALRGGFDHFAMHVPTKSK